MVPSDRSRSGTEVEVNVCLFRERTPLATTGPAPLDPSPPRARVPRMRVPYTQLMIAFVACATFGAMYEGRQQRLVRQYQRAGRPLPPGYEKYQ